MKMSKITLVIASNLVSTIAGLLVDKAASFSVEDAGTLKMRRTSEKNVNKEKGKRGAGTKVALELVELFAKFPKQNIKFDDKRILDIFTSNGLSPTSASPFLSRLRREGKIKSPKRGVYVFVGGE